MFTPPSSWEGEATLRPEGASTLSWTQALARRQGWLHPPSCAVGLTLQSSAAQGGPCRE